MTRRVFFFAEGQAEGPPGRKDILGGKGASLTAMTRAGLPVPPGFIIAADCCRKFLAAGGAWPDGLQQEVREALTRLEQVTGRTFGRGSDPLLVAVRSGAAVSMPGMMDTILNCPVSACGPAEDPWQALIGCIEAVFNSWNSPRAAAYRRQRDIRDLDGTAVTVQAMFPARVSGVAFTTNPNEPDAGEMIVEASPGLGEAVVSGRVLPDNFVVDRDTLAVKERRIRPKAPPVRAAGRTARPDPDAPALSDEQLHRVASLAMEVERLFGFPVDVEWGLSGDRPALLQARPVRASQAHLRRQVLESVRSALGQDIRDGRGPWVLHNLAETLAHPTPLTWSVQGRFLSGDGGFGVMYRLGGFAPGRAVRRDGAVRLIAGRVYMDISAAPEMFFEGYPFAYDVDLLRCDPEAAQAPPTRPTGTLRSRIAAGRRIAAARRTLHDAARTLDRDLLERTIPEFTAWCRAEKARPLGDLSADELVELWRQRERRVMDEFAPQSLLPNLVSGMALAELRAFLAEHFWDEHPDADELAGVLAAGAAPDSTLRANADLFAVAHRRRTVEQWLADHGHRGPDELDLATPRWRERSEEVAAMARRLEDGQDPVERHHAHLERVRSQTEALRQRLAEQDRRQFDRLVDTVRRYVRFREDGKNALMLGYDLLRDAALEAGLRLGIGDDVFFLTVAELHEALAAGAAPEERIAGRKAEYRAETRLALPRVIDADALDALARPPELHAAESYSAHEISAGIASGPVRIVTALEDAERLGRGYILVCRSTDTAWTPLFVNAAGLVLECGGALSHGAVVAREMGLPAVVLPDATSLLADGQTVTVDARRGLVATSGRPRDPAEAPGADDRDVRVPPAMVPPPAGRSERRAARARNIGLLVWGTYLLAVLLLPGPWLYEPSLAAIDAVLWPLVIHLGRPAAVALAAAALAVLTMGGQRLLTDNRRLSEAKRRAGRLTREAARLEPDSPRRAALARRAAPVNVRLLAAAMLPIALLLGPMIVTFLWFPSRVDPASWNAPPGTAVKVVAAVDSDYAGPVSLSVAQPAHLARSTPSARTAPPVRDTLAELLEHLRTETVDPALLADLAGPDRSADEVRASLAEYLRAGVPPQGITWEVRTPPGQAGRFGVTVTAGDAPPVRLDIVLGRTLPPGPTQASGGAGSPIQSLRAVYPPPVRKRIFWAPLAPLGWDHWDAGWLLTYLAAYLPVMFLLRWVLRIA